MACLSLTFALLPSPPLPSPLSRGGGRLLSSRTARPGPLLCSNASASAEEELNALRDEIEELRRENKARSEEIAAASSPPPPPPAPPSPSPSPSTSLTPSTPTPPLDDWDEAWKAFPKPAASEADERGEEGASELFRFDEPKRFTAGLDTSPDSQETRLVNLWSAKRSFQLISAVVLLTLAFYIFVGVTGGITDGFDRFSEPIEPIQQTMADENFQPDLPGMFGQPR